MTDIVISREEFDKILSNLQKGLDSPSNPAAMALSKMALQTLRWYIVEPEVEERGTCEKGCYND